MVLLIAGALALLGLAALGVALWRNRRAALPPGWTAITDGSNYGTDVDPATGAFTFPLLPSSIHYVTRSCGSLAGKTAIRLRYRIDAPPQVVFVPISDPHIGVMAIGPVIFFQRRGDDWSGVGKFETYRWWATFDAPEVEPGEHEIEAPLDARWTAIETSNAIDQAAAFQAALANADRIGFTFGGGTGFGHGVYATGGATFTLLELSIE